MDELLEPRKPGAHLGGSRKLVAHRAVRECEPGPVGLSLENDDLMAKSHDLCVSLFALHRQQPETSDQKPEHVQEVR